MHEADTDCSISQSVRESGAHADRSGPARQRIAEAEGRLVDAGRYRGAHRGGAGARQAGRPGRGACRIRDALAESAADCGTNGRICERLAWQASEYARFAEKIEHGMAAVEDRLAETVARILKPLPESRSASNISPRLSPENLSRILSKGCPRPAQDHRPRGASERIARQDVGAFRGGGICRRRRYGRDRRSQSDDHQIPASGLDRPYRSHRRMRRNDGR